MAEARRLKAGRWRIYAGDEGQIVRDPTSGAIATFDTLADARRWWARLHPDDRPLTEARRCARCGGYFGASTGWSVFDGRDYHPSHAPKTLEDRQPADSLAKRKT
ncbi:MAG: hypothetical protein ABI401_04575 [Candidatus Dormibacter sp.]